MLSLDPPVSAGVRELCGKIGNDILGQNRQGFTVADHEVRLSTQHLLVAGIDLDFDVKVDGGVLGTLSVSEGGLQWRPKGKQKSFGEQIPWREFAEWAES